MNRWSRGAWMVVLAALACGAAARAADEAFLVGACTHFGQNKGSLEQNLQSVRRAGIGSIRDELSWGGIERQQGKLAMPDRWDEFVRGAAKAGANPMLILDYGNRFYDEGRHPQSAEAIEGFCRYGEFVVRHFGKDVRLYEVWNEWDIGIGLPQRAKGTPESYAALLQAVYPRIKAVDGGITVLGGAPTPGAVGSGWLESVVKAGGLKSCDALSIHTYNYGNRDRGRTPEAWAEWMARVQDMLRKHNDGRDVPLYITEMGWPTHVGPRGTAPDLSAAYLARLFLLARTMSYLRGIWWYDFQDDGWYAGENEQNFGLVRPDLTPKPAYHALADVAPLAAAGKCLGREPAEDKELYVLRFSHDGRNVWAVWSADDQPRQVILQHPQPQPEGKVTLRWAGRPAIERGWGHRPWASKGGGAKLAANQISIVVDAAPCLVAGDLRGVVVKEAIARPREVEAPKAK